jgi:predicted ATPase
MKNGDSMNVKLKNIGIISDADVSVEGITVISGNNGTGKSTVGKVLYSVVDGLNDLYDKQKKDIAVYAKNVLEKARENFTWHFAFFSLNEEIEDEVMRDFFSRDDSKIIGTENDIENIKVIREHLQKIDFEQEDYACILKKYYKLNDTAFHDMVKNPHNNEEKRRAVALLDDLLGVYEGDTTVFYARRYVEKNLQEEFHNQIESQPVKQEPSRILLRGGKIPVGVDITIQDNQILEENFAGVSVEYNNVFYIDNSYVIDHLESPDKKKRDLQYLNHEEKLEQALSENEMLSEIEADRYRIMYQDIMKCMDRALPGKFEVKKGSYYLNDSQRQIRIENLATGCKMFAILKLLMEKGKINDKTLLIFDEPESHLHPKWQNLFAETIILLYKKVGCHIILTTHSSNFLLAIDALIRKYNILNNCKFYYAALEDNTNLSVYREVTDSLDTIYADFVAYLSEMKELRDQEV